MQFITRVLIVLAVLGGLGYGSYAFGKYVLSARLFGPQGTPTTTTAAVSDGGVLQAPSDVDVEVVPIPQTTEESEAADAPPVAPRPSATPDERVEIVPAPDNDNSSTRDSARDSRRISPEPTPRRRRRRARPTPRPKRRQRPEQRQRSTAAPQIQAPPTRTENVDPPASSNSDNDTPLTEAPRVETPRRSDPAPPRRERERRTDVAPEPRAEAPRVRPTSPRPVRRRESSPVPVPEGALGGRNESPVPLPG